MDQLDVRNSNCMILDTGAAEMIDRSSASLLENIQNTLAMIVHKDPISHLLSVAIDRDLLSSKGAAKHRWNEFLRMLEASIVIRASRHANIYSMCVMIGEQQQIRRCFRGGVWTRRGLRRLERKLTVPFDRTVHLVSRDLYKERYILYTCSFEERDCSKDIRLHEWRRTFDRAIDVTFGGEVNDSIELQRFEQIGDGIRIANIALYKLPDPIDVLEMTGVREGIEDHHIVSATQRHVREVRADKAGASGDKQTHQNFGGVWCTNSFARASDGNVPASLQ